MKAFFRRLFIRRRLARIATHLEVIQRERVRLDSTERYCIRAAKALHLELLNLDVRVSGTFRSRSSHQSRESV